jgi:peptidyl-prolyl cis-trans isomerase B (cyclophilin B)
MKVILLSIIFCMILVSYTSLAFAEIDALVLLETNSGNITIELFPNDAPKHVENFMELTQSGFYDNTTFHRIIKDFMIQGGDPKTKPDSGVSQSEWGTGGPASFVEAEFNNIKHNRGIVSMARSQDPDSAGSQFFIVHKDSSFLDQQYTVFGRIATEESFTTLDKIANVETGDKDVPTNIDDVRIIKASIVNRLQISDLIDLADPERIQSSTPIITTPSSNQFESDSLGVKFSVPPGWLLQQPLKTSSDSPDVVATGPKTGTLPAAITLTIMDTNGKTQAQLINEKLESLQSLIDEGAMQIVTSDAAPVNGRSAYTMFLEAFFVTGDKEINVLFQETSIYTPEKLYIFTLVNDDPFAFAEQMTQLDETLDSLEIIPIAPLEFQGYTEKTTETYYGDEMSKEEFLEMANERQEEYDKEQGGCLIATAAFGSEMAPQVQLLREIRDNTVLQTQSGVLFMTGFNQFYYSFSPAIADYERENPMFKEAVKVTLTPLLTSLTLFNYVDINTEQEMLGYGIGVILLNIGMYFVAPAAVIIAIKNRRK